MIDKNGAVLEMRIRKWQAVAKFVSGYLDLALKLGLRGFISEDHEAWCGEIFQQVCLPISAGLPESYSQRRNFEEQYCTLVSDHENVEDWLDSMVSRVREHLEMLDEEHLEMLEMPEDDPPADRPECQCRCGCRRQPRRRIPCVRCGHLICPGFCAVGHEDGAPEGICHRCVDWF